MSKTKALPPRSKVKESDRWDLSSLYKGDAEWEKAFAKWEQQIPGYAKFRGKLGDSAEMLSACLQFDASVDRTGERLGVYAYLRTTEDQANSDYQRMKGRYQHAATQAAAEQIKALLVQGQWLRWFLRPVNKLQASHKALPSSIRHLWIFLILVEIMENTTCILLCILPW